MILVVKICIYFDISISVEVVVFMSWYEINNKTDDIKPPLRYHKKRGLFDEGQPFVISVQPPSAPCRR